jgi:hypothetical protein
VGPAHRDKAEIKCMGSVGGKTSTKPKFYSSLTLGILSKILTLGILSKIKLMFICFA